MNFEFSDEQKFIQEQARAFLGDKCTAAQVREVLESDLTHHAGLWQQVIELGWPATAIPEEYGGLGLGYLELCVLAEEIGRSLLPAPVSSSIYLATEAIKLAGTEEQKRAWLPRLAAGEITGTVAFAELDASIHKGQVAVEVAGGKISGCKQPVADATLADFAVVAARDIAADNFSLYLLDLSAEGVTRSGVDSLDPSRPLGKLELKQAPVELLGGAGEGAVTIDRLLNGAAILLAFEQVGGAEAALNMAREYTTGRYAFGRPVASFQAIKHKLADMFVAIELARANAYYGAWALSTESPELPLAAATARVSATEAAWEATKENIQAHGGMGFTWEFDCHLYYRRAQHLALLLGGQRVWKNRLVEQLKPAASNSHTL
ncbi:MAG: acyl-CoA/acyl-ACP dehydrogenase [Gammaproteobacteria bacterium]|nr:acyl-CoA/acyl-ACP dehydrogenase [Gammaproteobacteria bacterium]